MNKMFTTFLTAGLLLIAAPLAVAETREANPDCEDDQDFVSYSPLGQSVAAELAQFGFFACEGEHWDGQDSVSDEGSSNDITSCGNTDHLNPSGNAHHMSFCKGANPNEDGASTLAGKPVTFRVSTEGEGTDQRAYVALDIAAVGHAVVYTEKDGSFNRNGVYIRDNIDEFAGRNYLADVVSAAGITKGYVSEEDCDHETYQENARKNDRTVCGRDNTAVTTEWHTPLP